MSAFPPMQLRNQTRVTDSALEDRIARAVAQGCHCQCKSAQIVRRLKKHGGVVVTVQCDNCGKSLTGDMSRQHFPFYLDLPAWDDDRREQFYGSEAWDLLRDERAQARAKALEERREEYALFRQTPEWHDYRHQVLTRAHFKCEACDKAPAEIAHHLTYAHGLMPPLWLMRAVCRPCHDRLHTDGDRWHDPALPVK